VVFFFFFFFFDSPILTNISLLLISKLSARQIYSLNACMKFVSIVEEILWIHIKSKGTNWYKNPNQKMNLPQKSQGMYKSTFIINSLTFDYICELSRNMDPYQISTISKHASPNFLLADRAKRDKGQHH
jgi:hypothetical protein